LGSLPFSVLFVLSDAVTFVLHRVLHYRRNVILDQLAICFPDRDEAWRHATMARFYRHLVDLMVESIKFPHMDLAERARRIKTEGLEVLLPYAKQGRSSVVVMGHLGSWEWGASGATDMAAMGIELVVVYKPPKNPSMEAWLKRTRELHGLRLVAMKNVDAFCQSRAEDPSQRPYALTLIADQSPAVPTRAAWTTFMGRDTAVFYGPERIARKFNLPVVYLESVRTSRGHYHYQMTEVVGEPRSVPEGAVTRGHLALLEAGIRRNPANWLWSHKRWKHRKPEGAHEL
jgi:KDO2-lipid IV(A) lauroyltransferase